MSIQRWFGILFQPAPQPAPGRPPLPRWAGKLLDDGADSDAMNAALAARGYQGAPLTWLVYTRTAYDYYALAVTESLAAGDYPEEVEDAWAMNLGQAASILNLPDADLTWHETISRAA